MFLSPLSTPIAGSPLSSWQPAVPPTRLVASYLADDIDPQTGEIMSITTGIDPTDATLITQARTERASGAAVLEDGHRLRDIESLDDDAPVKMRFEVKRLLDPFVARREIEVLELQIDAGGVGVDMGAILVRYRNLRTSAEKPLYFG